jgi:hypothetical protein
VDEVKVLILESVNVWKNYKNRYRQGVVKGVSRMISFKKVMVVRFCIPPDPVVFTLETEEQMI